MAKLSLLDVAIINRAEDKAMIVEASAVAPEVGIIPAMPIVGINYYTQVVTALPTGSAFRAANNGVDATKSTRENRLVECMIMNKRWSVDKMVADAHRYGWAALLASEAKLHLEAALQDLGSQIYYGTSADANGFQGFVSSVDTSMVVSATSATASTYSSVWGVRLGEDDVILPMGLDGRINITDPMEFYDDGSNSKPVRSYGQDLEARPGLQVGSKYSIGCIKNLNTTNTLDDDKLDALIAKFPVGKAPDVLFMNRRSLQQLKDSRTATNPTGAPAPWPDSIPGPNGKVIRIVVTDSITSTETGDGTAV